MIKPPPLVELWNTRGIGGRLAADGSIVEELDEAEVARRWTSWSPTACNP